MEQFYYGMLKSTGSEIEGNPLYRDEVKLKEGVDTEIFTLVGDGLVNQISFKLKGEPSLIVKVRIDSEQTYTVFNVAYLGKLYLTGEKGAFKSHVYFITFGIQERVISCHIPFRFKKSFKLIFQSAYKDKKIQNIHLFYLTKNKTCGIRMKKEHK